MCALSGNPLHARELGVTQLHARDPQAAKASLERALALAPADQMVLGLFALALRESGDDRYDALSRLEGQLGIY